MSAQDNATTLGKPNQNLVLETAGRIYVKVQDRFYELDFRNQGRGSGDTKIEIVNNSSNNQDIDLKGYVTKEFLKASLNSYVTKRSWNDVKETQSMLENAMLDGFTESINPITIQTMQVIIGADQLQFEFVDNFINANETTYGPNLYKNSIEFIEPSEGIYIKHYTLDGPTDVRPEDPNDQTQLNQLKMQYCRWRIAPNRFDLGDPSASYYIYIKVPRLRDDSGWINSSDPMTIYTKTNAEGTNVYNSEYGGLGEFVLSNTAIEMTSESHYYYLLYGMINSDDGNGRSFSTMNGFTEILPGQITAYIFKSASGDSYLDLRKNELKLGDAFQWNINNNHILYIKGAIVVDDGGNESYMYLDRGIFHRYRYLDNSTYIEDDSCQHNDAQNEGNVYYQGNTVVWTNEKGITSTYMYIGPNEDANNNLIHAYNSCDPDPIASEDPDYNPSLTYFDPTNENFWRVIAKGVRGYSNLIADLSNEMEAIACDKDGYVITENGLTVSTQAGLFYGTSDVELHYTESGSTIVFDGITIDLSEINNLNQSNPPSNSDPQITYTITDTDPISHEKIITFNIPYKLKLPEKAEIPITLKSKYKYGEEDDDTRIIVFTLVGARSGKAYNLVPSCRTIQRDFQGVFHPDFVKCGVVCNGSDDNIATDASEIIVKRIFDDSEEIDGITRDIDWINAHLSDFLNDSNSTWDWDASDGQEAFIDLTQGAVTFEKITFFLYYRDPFAPSSNPRWILCDRETIFVVKDGLLGQDLNLITSSQVFAYEEESSRVPLNSEITLTAILQNITVANVITNGNNKGYLWQYRIPGGNWTTISEQNGHWRQATVDGNTVNYFDELTIQGPILNNQDQINWRDFDIYFPTQNPNDPDSERHRMCEFRVTVSYRDLNSGVNYKTLTDQTSLHIIKGGDGSLTIYLTNPTMLFASTVKGGVSPNLAEKTEVVAYYGIDQILGSNNISTTISKYTYIDVNNIEQTYYSTNTPNNAVTASTNYTDGHLYVIVNTGNGLGQPFIARSGSIELNITINFADAQTETVTRTIYWTSAQQGEPGAGKQLRGRSEWGGQYGYYDMEWGRRYNNYPQIGLRLDYQGLHDEESNWISAFGHNWDEETNIYFDLISYNDNTYYCKNGGACALWGDPTSSYFQTNCDPDNPSNSNFNNILPPDHNDYAWAMMTYINIASDVAYINKALIEELKVKKLYTPGIPGVSRPSGSYVYVKQLSIANNALNITNGRNDVIVDISSNDLPTGQNSGASHGDFGGNSGNCSSSGSCNIIILSGSAMDDGKLSISPFTININYSSLGNTLIEGMTINLHVWLSTSNSGGSGILLEHFIDNTITTNHTFDVDGGLYDISTGNFYIIANVSYSTPNNNAPTYSIGDGAYSIIYKSASEDGTIIAGNGFQTQWSNNKINVTDNGLNLSGSPVNITSNDNLNIVGSSGANIDVNGTVKLGGTVNIIRNNSTFSAVGGSNVSTIYVQSSNNAMIDDGLYFLY